MILQPRIEMTAAAWSAGEIHEPAGARCSIARSVNLPVDARLRPVRSTAGGSRNCASGIGASSDTCGHRHAELAFRVDESIEDSAPSRVDFVPRVRSHEHGIGRGPALALPLAESERSVERHDELNAVMPLQVGPRLGTP
jgi:hypothetical protein